MGLSKEKSKHFNKKVKEFSKTAWETFNTTHFDSLAEYQNEKFLVEQSIREFQRSELDKVKE